MTSFSIRHFRRDPGDGFVLEVDDPRLGNWPVVYLLGDHKQIYIGESVNVRNRFFQHLKSEEKEHLTSAYVIVDPSFNKSAALDLESHLVRLLAGDGQFEVLNRNDGIIDADYFDRAEYRKRFEEIFEEFRKSGIFSKSAREIENSDLFKLSPFKALNVDQEQTVGNLISDLLDGLSTGTATQSVIQGDPGTGKTVVGIFLMKLLVDLGSDTPLVEPERDTVLSDPSIVENRHLVSDFRIGMVVPQQALRSSIERVFSLTPGLGKTMVLTPFEVGKSDEIYDLLIVDETHRLGRRANQSSGPQNKSFREINEKLFGSDDPRHTQLDWVVAQSRHQAFLLDAAQSVRPSDLAPTTLGALEQKAKSSSRFYPLKSQMRVKSGDEYIAYMRAALSPDPPEPRSFSGYELRWFEDLAQMERLLLQKEQEAGLARMVAGYAWPWVSKKDPSRYDIEIDDVRRRWNTTDKDWVQSPGAIDEVGSIHTIQGYDLNYAAVIIGGDLRFDPAVGRLYVDKENYFDKKGKESSPSAGVTVTDEDLLQWVTNVYVVLLTRGIRGTFIYVCDPALRERLRPLFARGAVAR